MPSDDPPSTAFLLVETTKKGEPVWAVKWRSADGERVRRRLGARAWLVRDGSRGWRPRSGRPAPGHLTEYQARRGVVEFVEAVEADRAAVRARTLAEAECKADAGGPTFRELAHAWLEHVEFVLGAKPATLRDYRSMLAEPGTPHRRGRGVAIGRLMAALGDVPVAEVSTAQIEAVLMAHAREGVGARSVNKHRQVLCAIFNFGLHPEQAERWRLTSNPAAAAPKRREAPPAWLEVFTVEQIEALARAAESGAWRGPHDDSPTPARCCAPRRTPSSPSCSASRRTPASAAVSSSPSAGATSGGPSACSSSNARSPATSRAQPRAAASATSRSATRHSAH